MSGLAGFVSKLWKVRRPLTSNDDVLQDEVKSRGRLANPAVSDPDRDLDTGSTKQMGVYIAEATYATTGASFYLLVAFLMMASFVNLLDNQITYSVTVSGPGSVFNASALATTALTLQSIIVAITKPFVSKFADVFGRATCACIVMFFYILGFLVMAVSQSMADYTGGVVLWAIGNSGLQIVIQILLADYFSSRNRAFAIAVFSAPTFIVFAVGPRIVGALVPTISATAAQTGQKNEWRWAVGMFTILVPFVMSPIIMVLFANENKAKRAGLLPVHPYRRLPFTSGVVKFLKDIDFGGLLMLSGGFLLLLLPLTLESNKVGGYQHGWVIALVTVGGVMILATPLYERFISPEPFLRRAWLNSDVVLTMILGFFDYVAFQITYRGTYWWAMETMHITDQDNLNYFNSTQMVTMTLFAIIAGLIISYTRRFKYLLVFAAVLRLVGIGLMMRFRHTGTTMVQAVWPQVVQGIGGGVLGVLLQLAAQVSVRHQDVAMVTAAVLLFFELGGAVGTTIFFSIYMDQSRFQSKLAGFLPQIPAADRSSLSYLYCSPAPVVASLPQSCQADPQMCCDGAMNAFNDVIYTTLIAAIVFAAVPIICSLFISDWVLTDTQNVVSDELPAKNMFKFKSDDIASIPESEMSEAGRCGSD